MPAPDDAAEAAGRARPHRYWDSAYCVAPINGTFTRCGKSGAQAKMGTQAKKVLRGHVSPTGRVSLPAEFRRAVGLERGGDVVVELDGNDIRIRTIDEAVARAQAMSRRLLAGKRSVSVDDFLKERKADWKEP